MQEDFIETELAGSKWMILKTLSKAPQSPKQVAQKLNTTIANTSQQLKLLEAYGYVKKLKVDKGKGSREKKDARILYFLNKSKSWIIALNFSQVVKKEIKQSPENLLLQNLLLLELKEQMHFLKFITSSEDFFSLIQNLFFLRREETGKLVEIHLLIISEAVERFRDSKSSLDVNINGKIVKFRFWSHTAEEFVQGVQRNEKYFQDLATTASLIYEKTLNSSEKLLGGLR